MQYAVICYIYVFNAYHAFVIKVKFYDKINVRSGEIVWTGN